MLSIAPIKNSGDAKRYFEPEQYYQQDNMLAQHTAWFGVGAEALGLTGAVGMERFRELLDGKISAEVKLGRKIGGEEKRQLGWDLTFSAPKSVSILTLVGGDGRLMGAHAAAVESALQVLEREFLVTRQYVADGKVAQVNSESLVAARFLHSVSREAEKKDSPDPQLHTHCVVANATLRNDGKWRSIHSINIYDHKMLLGQIYRNELALQVQKLGYELEIDYRRGLFEIKGVPAKAIEKFSKRSELIREVARSDSSKELQRATLNTRLHKKKWKPAELYSKWLSECNSVRFSQRRMEALKEAAVDRASVQQTLVADATESVSQVINQVTSGEAVFSRRQLCEQALRLGLGETSYAATQAAVVEQLAAKGLVQSALSIKGRVAPSFTTPEALRRENYILQLLEQGRGGKSKIAFQWQVNCHLREQDLTQGQIDAIKLITTSRDQFIGVQGFAGVGKTTMLRALKELVESRGHTIKAFAPTHAAVGALKSETGVEARTLTSFLNAMELKQSQGSKAIEGQKEVWLVDEASMVGAKDMATLMTQARKAGSRIVLLGDRAQLGSISWGKPFHLMKSSGMQCAVMREIMRQKDKNLKQAVEAVIEVSEQQLANGLLRSRGEEFKQLTSASERGLERALSAIGRDVVVEEDREGRHNKLVSYYHSLTHEERKNSLVIIPDHKSRFALMPKLREIALQNLESKGPPVSATVLTSVLCSNHGIAKNYKSGEVVEFKKSYRRLGVKAGDRFYVRGVNGKENRVTLEPITEEGKDKGLFLWDLGKGEKRGRWAVELFEERQIELVKGERITFTKSIKALGVKNNSNAVINGIDTAKGHIDATLDDGNKISFNYAQLSHFDHGYADTAYKAQGKTVDRVIFLAESKRERLITQQSFYVALSRARYGVQLFTDSKKDLIEGLAKRSGEKSSAVEQDKFSAALAKSVQQTIEGAAAGKQVREFDLSL